MNLDELKNIAVLVAAGVSTAGIPVIIGLLGRIYDAQVKSIERTTAKSVKDEVAAFKELHALQAEQIKSRIASTQKKAISLSLAEFLVQQELAESIDGELGSLGFRAGSRESTRAYESLLPHLSQLRESLDQYKKSIVRQKDLWPETEASV